MGIQYRCQNQRRREIVRDTQVNGLPLLNGIDYLEVTADQKTLIVYFIHHLANSSTNQIPPNFTPLRAENLLITGGIRLQSIQIESVSSFANILTIRLDSVGDFSTYTLRLVKSPSTQTPPTGFDPQLSQIDFSFWVEEFSEFDCQPSQPLPKKQPPPPVIDYLAKDYASFRRLMLDRLAVTIPQWQERNPADIGIMLVELLAYAGDRLSYYQDAVATEAYLGTARKRVSVRRHARLLDYLLHDGCNARTWVVIHLKNDLLDGMKLLGPSQLKNRPGVKFLTKTNLSDGVFPEEPEKFNAALKAGAQVFESLHDLTLYYSLNKICFYTWGNEQCHLAKGATEATLEDPDGLLQKRLSRGSILVFVEIVGRESGDTRDADLKHRHVVRLTQVQGNIDPLNNQQIVEIAWTVEDSLPFDLYISHIDRQGKAIANISVAYGNVVLVDAGRTLNAEDLSEDFGWERLRPRLQEGPLTQQGYIQDGQNQWVLFDPTASASQAMQWQLRDVDRSWQPQRDLLNSDRFARDFVVETEDDGRAYLRFGDDVLGKKPQLDTHLYATYRIGNGRQGNVGAGAIAHILIQPENLKVTQRPEDWDISNQQLLQTKIAEFFQTGIESVHNPLPAQGGTEPEPIEQVRLYAPEAFQEQRRAVTEADYADVAKRYPGVQTALATRRWTGSWHTIFITVDRQGGLPIDDQFKQGLLTFLEEFRLTGHDIEIDAPRFISLDIAIAVKVEPDYFRSAVKKALLDAFSNRILANNQVGFFSSDRLTFGQSVYLSQIIAAAMQVSGVNSVKVTRFQRWGESDKGELEAGLIQFDRLEIARLDNTPNAPENGRIEFNLEGGL
jgi:Baseplate J-like protein